MMENYLEAFCSKKKIDLEKLLNNEPELAKKWQKMLSQMSEESFSVQELFIINNIRRKYPFQGTYNPTQNASIAETPIEKEQKPQTQAKPKPMFKPKSQ